MLITKQILGSIGALARGYVSEEFLWAMLQMCQYNNEFLTKHDKGQIIHMIRGNGSGQHLTRNYMAASMIGDWLLMLDSDHTFEPDLLHRMLAVFNKWDLDVLSGLYQYTEPPYGFKLYKYKPDSNQYQHYVSFHFTDTDPRRFFEIDCAGAGTLLIRKRVFDRISNELGEKPFDMIGSHGEDFSFFDRLRTLGIKSYCCPAIQTYHLRTQETRIEEYDPSDMIVAAQYEVPSAI